MIYIDSAYTLAEVRSKNHEAFFLARDASGLFKEIWSVHPAADAVRPMRYPVEIARIETKHVIVEAKWARCSLPKVFSPLNVIISQFALYKLLVRIVRTRNISIVVAVDPYLNGLLGLAVARRTRRPFVVRISGNADEIYDAAGALAMPRLIPSIHLQRAIQRFIFKRADLVTAINRNNLSFGVANGASKATAIIPISANVAPVHRMPPENRPRGDGLLRKLSVSADAPKLLYVGRLIPLKHPDDALRAMARSIEQNPLAVGIFAGTGSMRPELERLANELGVHGSIHFVGQLTQDELSVLIPHCILLSPSAGQLALLEGALGGAPIVAYDRDFQPEFIEDGVDGFIVAFRDYRSMATRADEIIRDPDLAMRLGSAVRRKALHHVDSERVKQLEQDAYRRVLDPQTRQSDLN